jgi:S1-C subfamily serine protease
MLPAEVTRNDGGSESGGVSRRAFLGALGAGAAGALAGCPTPDGNVVNPGSGAGGNRVENVFTDVYRGVIDSVGQVRVRTAQGGGQGTGWVFDDGVLVTNFHVIEGATDVSVRFGDGRVRDAEILGSDPYSDLAALEPAALPSDAAPLPLVDDPAVVGQRVVIVGSPFGLAGSATAGIVSGINRLIPSPAGYQIPDAVQTDAAANPGNSGGPLVSLDSEVVAVINSGGGDNIAFGISAALTSRVVPSLVEDGEYTHPYLGVSLVEVGPEIAAANDLEEATGLIVTSVDPDGPSDGVLRGSDVEDGLPVGGDVIVGMGDQRIAVLEDLASYLELRTRPGDDVPMTVVRDGERTTVTVTVGTRPPPDVAPAMGRVDL